MYIVVVEIYNFDVLCEALHPCTGYLRQLVKRIKEFSDFLPSRIIIFHMSIKELIVSSLLKRAKYRLIAHVSVIFLLTVSL